jgi:hypothetical protein
MFMAAVGVDLAIAMEGVGVAIAMAGLGVAAARTRAAAGGLPAPAHTITPVQMLAPSARFIARKEVILKSPL